jgi:hypothetical protein
MDADKQFMLQAILFSDGMLIDLAEVEQVYHKMDFAQAVVLGVRFRDNHRRGGHWELNNQSTYTQPNRQSARSVDSLLPAVARHLVRSWSASAWECKVYHPVDHARACL